MAAQPIFPFLGGAMSAKPFVKWAGGKSRLLPTLKKIAPRHFSRYFEPFVGGGAYLFSLAPERPVINDLNAELMECYRAIRDDPTAVLASLAGMVVSKAEFYRWRAQRPASLAPSMRVARFIYLNKTCFNGLYRVNKKGEFNAPFGGYEAVALADASNLFRCSQILRQAEICDGDYKDVLQKASSGDFIYLDPPYVPVGPYSDFNRYTAQPFVGTDQERLAELFAELDRRGCYLLLSNSRHPIVEKLYETFHQHTVRMPRYVNCKGDKRGDIDEILVTNYEIPNELS